MSAKCNMESSGNTFAVFPSFSFARFGSTVSSAIASVVSSALAPRSDTRMRKQHSAFGTLLSAVVLLIAVGGMLPQAAVAESMHSTGALASGAVWAQDPVFNNSVWVHSTIGGGLVRGSGIAIDPWNVLTAGHIGWSNAQGGVATQFLLGTGSNYISNPGTMFNVTNYTFHPQWDGTTFGQRVDLMMLHIPEGIPGMTDILDFDFLTLGEKVQGVGFGQPGTGGSGYLPIDGTERALYMFADQFGNGGTISTNYFRNYFHPLFIRNEPMAGGLTPGDSGSAVFDLSGNLVAMGVGVTGTVPLYGYSSYSLRLDLFETWINNNRIVPEPGTLGLLAFGALALLRRRRWIAN